MKLRITSSDITFNTALISSSGNLELTFVTPVGGPLVVNQPVRRTVLNTPTLDLDAVTTEVTARLVAVNTTLVVQEIFVDAEASFNRSLGKVSP